MKHDRAAYCGTLCPVPKGGGAPPQRRGADTEAPRLSPSLRRRWFQALTRSRRRTPHSPLPPRRQEVQEVARPGSADGDVQHACCASPTCASGATAAVVPNEVASSQQELQSARSLVVKEE